MAAFAFKKGRERMNKCWLLILLFAPAANSIVYPGPGEYCTQMVDSSWSWGSCTNGCVYSYSSASCPPCCSQKANCPAGKYSTSGKLVQNLNRVHGSLLNFLGSGTEGCSTCSSNYYSYTGFDISLDMFFCMKCHPRFNLLMRQATKSEYCCDAWLNSSSSISVGVNDSP
jgi:hypothetical protein